MMAYRARRILCNEATEECEHFANNAVCNDGLPCNGVETCDATSDCQAGMPIGCADGFNCSTDTCSPSNGSLRKRFLNLHMRRRRDYRDRRL